MGGDGDGDGAGAGGNGCPVVLDAKKTESGTTGNKNDDNNNKNKKKKEKKNSSDEVCIDYKFWRSQYSIRDRDFLALLIGFISDMPDGTRSLRLDDVLIESSSGDKLRDFANCFAATETVAATGTKTTVPTATIPTATIPTNGVGYNRRWENLTALSMTFAFVESLDPIFRAVGGGGTRREQGQGRDDRQHLPNLETFRLTTKKSYGFYQLNDDEVFIRFMKNRTTIKELALNGFVQPRHCPLMERHLSAHPNIEKLRLNARDFFDSTNSDSGAPSPEEEPAVRDAVRSLVRLASANPNLKVVSVGGPFFCPLDDLLKPHLRELFATTRLNRSGLKHFRRGGTRRDCVEFLAGLLFLEGTADLGRWPRVYGEELESLVILDALYLVVKMKPDPCL